MKLTYPAYFYPCEELTGGYTVVIPDLRGCVTQGKTLADAIIMAEDAASGWVLDELEEGNDVPAASSISNLDAEEGGFTTIIVIDIDSYAAKYGSKAVHKNLTIPAWLNTKAEALNINFSQVFREALEERVGV